MGRLNCRIVGQGTGYITVKCVNTDDLKIMKRNIEGNTDGWNVNQEGEMLVVVRDHQTTEERMRSGIRSLIDG